MKMICLLVWIRFDGIVSFMHMAVYMYCLSAIYVRLVITRDYSVYIYILLVVVFVKAFSLIEHMFVQIHKTQVMYYFIKFYHWTWYYVTVLIVGCKSGFWKMKNFGICRKDLSDQLKKYSRDSGNAGYSLESPKGSHSSLNYSMIMKTVEKKKSYNLCV